MSFTGRLASIAEVFDAFGRAMRERSARLQRSSTACWGKPRDEAPTTQAAGLAAMAGPSR